MIITRTPFRISFVGGGSDIKEFYVQYPGAVLSTTINKYMYISSHYFFDRKKLRVKYALTETVKHVNELKHPIVAEVFKKFNIKGALEMSSNGDVPSGSGLGSSSSFTVGLLHNLYTLQGKFVTKDALAYEACKIEINKIGEPIGKQDQYAAAHGGLNIIRFHPSGKVSVEPIHLKKDTYQKLEHNLLMFYTGSQRRSSSILLEQKKNMSKKKNVSVLKDMVELVWKLRDALYEDNLEEFGRLLHKNWLMKKRLASKISNPEIDKLYDKAIAAGALGGKLLGAGSSGFLLFYCEKEYQKQLRMAMRPLRELKFRLDSEGSKLIYVGDEYNEK